MSAKGSSKWPSPTDWLKSRHTSSLENLKKVLTISVFNFERACPALKHDRNLLL
ncbi:MAG: hypothetical protein RJB45_2178, partial [Pseudomonadota bacterium]